MKQKRIPAIVTASIALSVLFLISSGIARSEVRQPGQDDQRVQVEGMDNVRPMQTTTVTWDQQGWARTWKGQVAAYPPDISANSVSISPAGTIFVAGNFLGTIDFDPGTSTFNASSNGYDCYLSKFAMNGDFEWVRTFTTGSGIPFRVNARSVDTDRFGNVYLTGDFMGTVDFDPDPANELILTATGGASPDPFLCKFNSSGELLWAKDKSTSQSEEYGWDVKVDNSNNVFWSGYYVVELTDIDSGDTMRSHYTFLTKFDSDGNELWNRKWPGSGGNDDMPSLIDVDSAGAVYVTGYYFNIADLSGGVDPDNWSFGSTPGVNNYILKYTSDGVFVWASTWGNDKPVFCNGVAVDDPGQRVYAAGTILNGEDPVDFSGGDELPGAVVEPEGYCAGYMVCFNMNTGTFSHVRLIDGPGMSECAGLVIDQNSNLFTMGKFNETIDCGGEILTAVEDRSIYVARLSVLGSDLWTNVLTSSDSIVANGIDIDPAFGAYVTGYFKGVVDFSPGGTDNHNSTPDWPASFLVSYPESGTWGRLIMQDFPDRIRVMQ